MVDYTEFIFQRKIFLSIILITLINSSYSYLAFKYPYAFKLNNKNIFVIHELGITICDQTFTQSIDRVVTFSDSEKINTDSALSKVTSVIADNYIICLINDKIYIFNEEGYFLKKSDFIITNLNVDYYSLVYTGAYSSYNFYFVIGFIYDRKLYLYSYKYNTLEKKIEPHKSLENANCNSYIIKNTGLSCQYMKYSSSNLITCVYHVTGGIAFDFFEFGTSYLRASATKSCTHLAFVNKDNYEVKLIRTVLLSGQQVLMVGWLTATGIPLYYFYYINVNKEYVVGRFELSFCELKPYGFQINYFPDGSGIIFTCVLVRDQWTKVEKANILVESFYGNGEYKDYGYKYNNCDINGYSIVYLNNKNNYYIISDADCTNKLWPFNLLFGDLNQQDIIIHTEYIKEEILVIEEEKEKELEEEYIEEEKNQISFYEEEKMNIYEEENIEIQEEEKMYKFEEGILDTLEKEKLEAYEEEKINIHEEEKLGIYEEEKILIKEEKINEFEGEKGKENIKEEDIENKLEKEIIKEIEKKYEEIKEENLEEEKEIKTENKFCEQLEKCELCNEESVNKNLCIKCNNFKGYYFLNKDSISKEEMRDEYIDCVNNETKPSNFYFNEENKDYRLCYKTCATCDKGGNWKINNCKTCGQNYIFKPDINPTTNCVIKCPFYYYYTRNGQYKCSEDYYCPLNYILLKKEKGKCTNDCKKDNTYKYQYDNHCLNECPDNTINDTYICKDKYPENSFNTETFHTFFNANISDENMAKLVKNYMNNFYYTPNHISTYESNDYTITIYKNTESITKLSLGIPKINFENCYTKIKTENNINDDLIIVLETKKLEKENNKFVSLSVYDPRKGEKIIFNDLCLNDSVIIQEKLEDKIDNLDSFLYLINQNIEILNQNSDFYTDLCTHFKSPFDGKDIPLKERFKLFFPNVSLCDKGCSIKGINTTTNTSICECKLNDLINNEFLGENIFFQSTMAELKTFFQETNIEVLRCYKDLFHLEFYTSNYGSFVILGLLLIQIILTVIYYKKFIFSMRKYLYNLLQTFLFYLAQKGNPSTIKLNNSLMPISSKLIQSKSNPIKKSSKKVCKKNYECKIDNKNSNIQARNKNEINYNMNKESQRLSSFEQLINKRSNNFSYGKKRAIRNLNLNSKFSNFDNSLMLGKVLDINVKEYVKTDPDDMDYDNAIGRDKRTFCVYFCDNIKTDLLILNIFCNYEKLNPWPIKFLLFILNVDLYFFVNGLFFTEDYLSEMLYDKNVNFFDFTLRFIDRLYYITLINIIISYVINCFFFEERVIKKIFKREKNNELILKYEMFQIIKNIKSRYNLFIIICFVAAIFIWYYSFCFNNIYPSMAKEWIITSVIIIFVMQFVYFLKLLLETIIRFIAIKCKSERLFKISQFLT